MNKNTNLLNIYSNINRVLRLNIPTQVGSSADHTPFSVQRRRLTPLNLNPGKQVYMATELNVVPGTVTTSPFSGSSRGPQSRATYIK